MTKGWKVAVIAVAVGVGTYFGLELLLPHHKVEVKMSGLVPADTVFSGKLQSPDEVAAAATPGAATADAGASTPSGPAVAADDAMAEHPDDSAALETGDSVDSDDQDLITSDDEADASAADAESDSGESSDEQTSPSSASAVTPAAPPAKPAAPPKPVAPAAPPKPVAPAAPPKPVAPAAKPDAKTASKPASKPAEHKTPTAAAGKPAPWWSTSGKDKGLQVIYVGSAAFERAIVVMGSAPFSNASSATQNIRITDASGNSVAGIWKLGNNNPAMLVFPVNKSGRFQVSIGAGLSDAKQRKLGQSVKGPVVVQ